MAINKLTLPAKENAVQEKINEIIDELGTSTGANTDLSNLTAAGEAHFQAPLVSGTNIKTINSTSLLGSGNIDVLQNTSTGLLGLSILGSGIGDFSVCVGEGTYVYAEHGVTIGFDSGIGISANRSIAIGYTATVADSVTDAIQIGYGTNETANSLSVGFFNNPTTHYNWTLLDGITGKIPNARINMDTAPVINSTNAITSNAVKTALDGKVSKSGDTMTGALYVPTPATNSNSDEVATTSYVHKQVQGGRVACSGNTATWVAFPTTFPSDNVAVAIVRKASDTATGGTYVPFVRQHYSSGFNLYNPASGAQTVFWIAIWLG